MKGHIHTDVIAGVWTLGFVVVGLHTMRMIGAYLGAKGGAVGSAGKTIGALATFNGG